MRDSTSPSATAPGFEKPAVVGIASEINTALDHGHYSRGYELLTDLIRRNGNQAADHLLAGLVALKLDRPDLSQRHFECALECQPENRDALHNLALLSLGKQDTGMAEKYLRRLRQLEPDNGTVYNDLGVVQLEKRRPHRALAAFRRALRLDPNFSVARNNAMEICLTHGWLATAKAMLAEVKGHSLSEVSKAEINRWRELLESDKTPTVETPYSAGITDKKIAIFATHDMFIKGIAADLSRDNQVRHFSGDRLERMQELLKWADLAWFEWCDQLLIAATKLPKTCHIICRLHSYEAFSDMPQQVDWSKVDHLVFVNKSVRDLVRNNIPATLPTTIIYNGVDLSRFVLPIDKPVTKKIASVGYINYKKNPALLLYAFKKIHEYDPGYTLHIAGQHQDPRIELYMTNFLKRHPLPVFFEGWIEDMRGWYRDKQFVISTSLFESFHYSIAEGMASGCLPLIHDWFGSDYLYPERFLFGDPDSCLEVLRDCEDSDMTKLRRENREFIALRYRQEDATVKIRSLLAEVIGRNSQSTEHAI
jgi:glycosyltransferase involved in cell wall biosynthesis